LFGTLGQKDGVRYIARPKSNLEQRTIGEKKWVKRIFEESLLIGNCQKANLS
jgi:hypothetical protein